MAAARWRLALPRTSSAELTQGSSARRSRNRLRQAQPAEQPAAHAKERTESTEVGNCARDR